MSTQLVRFSALIARDEFQSGSLSDQAQIDLKAYFVAVKQRFDSGEQFPYNLDELVPTVFVTRQKAIYSLKKEFTQDVDFIRLTVRLDGNPNPREDYYLSPRAFEFMVAKKNKEIFFIYHRVFHVATQPSASATGLLAQAMQMIEAEHRARLDAHDLQLALQNQKVRLLDKHVTTLVKVITSHRQPPVLNTKQIGLDLVDPPAKPRGEPKGGTHAAPRSHERQGHYRTRNGKRTWVRPTKVNKKAD